jgi:hypothetical protein
VVDGGVRFDPDKRFSGDATFQYYVQDSGGLTSNPVTVTVSVGVNSPPVAGNFAVTVDNDVGTISYNVFQAPTGDPDGDDLTLLPLVGVSNGTGTAVGVGETVTYVPGVLVPGQVVTLTYTITDDESTASGTITVTVRNRAPTAGNDTASGMGLSGSVNVLANDTDPDGDTLTVTGASIDSVSRVDPPPQPTTDPTDTTTAPTVPPNPGVSIDYTPSTVTYSVADPTFVGTIVLSYTISDGHGGSASGKITITVS